MRRWGRPVIVVEQSKQAQKLHTLHTQWQRSPRCRKAEQSSCKMIEDRSIELTPVYQKIQMHAPHKIKCNHWYNVILSETYMRNSQ